MFYRLASWLFFVLSRLPERTHNFWNAAINGNEWPASSTSTRKAVYCQAKKPRQSVWCLLLQLYLPPTSHCSPCGSLPSRFAGVKLPLAQLLRARSKFFFVTDVLNSHVTLAPWRNTTSMPPYARMARVFRFTNAMRVSITRLASQTYDMTELIVDGTTVFICLSVQDWFESNIRAASAPD